MNSFNTSYVIKYIRFGYWGYTSEQQISQFLPS